MAPRIPGRSEGVQIRLDPTLKQEARVYLAMANMTWQELLEPCVRQFVEHARAQAMQGLGQCPQPDKPQDAIV